MAVASEPRFAKLEDLWLDPRNPRLGAEKIAQKLDQEALLDEMRDWELEELAESFMESGFWVQESLLVVKEKQEGVVRLVVVEGNRRLAALRYLKRAADGHAVSPKWRDLLGRRKPAGELFRRIPYLTADDREELDGYLGFRHVSGIKEWEPREKAAFIAKLIDKQKLTYAEVMRRIGSKTETVRRTYIAYRVLEQMRENDEKIDVGRVEKKFSVLFLALRYSHVQEYLGVDLDMDVDAARAKHPVPPRRIASLANFAVWLFGKGEVEPLVEDSRHVGKFDQVLASAAARTYLENARHPDLETAYFIAGGEEGEVFSSLESASSSLRLALGAISAHRQSKRIQESTTKVGRAAMELLRGFPAIRSDLLEEERKFDLDSEAASKRRA
jgi:hypothetical protein